MARRKPADTVHLRLRFPEKLRRRIEAAAEKNQRSMNAEIAERLERSFGQEDTAATIEATANAVAERITNLASRRIDEKYSKLINELDEHEEDFGRRYAALHDARAKEREDLALKLLMERNPSLDKHAARERMDALIIKHLTPRPQKLWQDAIWAFLRFLEGERIPESLRKRLEMGVTE